MNPSFFENKRYWMHELEGINSNIPKNRVTLFDLLTNDIKGFQIKEGFQEIPNKELLEFASLFSEAMYEKLFLPIVMLQQGDHFITSGNKYASWAVEVMMGHEQTSYIISIVDYQPKYKYYYSYQVNRIRRRFPTIVQLVFSMT